MSEDTDTKADKERDGGFGQGGQVAPWHEDTEPKKPTTPEDKKEDK